MKLLVVIAARNRWHHRQQDMRRAISVDEDTIAGDARMFRCTFRLARIRVDIEMREIAARDVEPQPMAGHEQVACREKLDRDPVNLTWRQR
jgi:hypothetical protein